MRLWCFEVSFWHSREKIVWWFRHNIGIWVSLVKFPALLEAKSVFQYESSPL